MDDCETSPRTGSNPASSLIYYGVLVGVVVSGTLQNRVGAGDIPFLLMHAAMSEIRKNYQPFAAKPVAVTIAPGREKTLIAFVVMGMTLMPLLSIATPLLDFASYSSPVPLVLLGTSFATCGIILFWRAHADLGSNWSAVLELGKDQELVTWGVYSKIRHPMYAAIFLLAFAQVGLIGNWIAGWSGLVAVGLLYALRIQDEEKMMQRAFADEWSAYVSETRRVIPRLILRPRKIERRQ